MRSSCRRRRRSRRCRVSTWVGLATQACSCRRRRRPRRRRCRPARVGDERAVVVGRRASPSLSSSESQASPCTSPSRSPGRGWRRSRSCRTASPMPSPSAVGCCSVGFADRAGQPSVVGAAGAVVRARDRVTPATLHSPSPSLSSSGSQRRRAGRRRCSSCRRVGDRDAVVAERRRRRRRRCRSWSAVRDQRAVVVSRRARRRCRRRGRRRRPARRAPSALSVSVWSGLGHGRAVVGSVAARRRCRCPCRRRRRCRRRRDLPVRGSALILQLSQTSPMPS